MRIRLCFVAAPDERDAPWLLQAVDEYTEENWGKTPDWYTDAIAEHKLTNADNLIREVMIDIDDDAVTAQFAVPEIAATMDIEENGYHEDGTHL
jgi:hypothetical protein